MDVTSTFVNEIGMNSFTESNNVGPALACAEDGAGGTNGLGKKHVPTLATTSAKYVCVILRGKSENASKIRPCKVNCV